MSRFVVDTEFEATDLRLGRHAVVTLGGRPLSLRPRVYVRKITGPSNAKSSRRPQLTTARAQLWFNSGIRWCWHRRNGCANVALPLPARKPPVVPLHQETLPDEDTQRGRACIGVHMPQARRLRQRQREPRPLRVFLSHTSNQFVHDHIVTNRNLWAATPRRICGPIRRRRIRRVSD